jgi:hypothetical protein
VLSTAKVNAIPGLYVQVKRAEEQPAGVIDPEYLEVMGLPPFGSDETLITDYAEALLRTVEAYVSFDKAKRLDPAD